MWALAPHAVAEKRAHRSLSALRRTLVESIRYVAPSRCRRRPRWTCSRTTPSRSPNSAAGRWRLASLSVGRLTGSPPSSDSRASPVPRRSPEGPAPPTAVRTAGPQAGFCCPALARRHPSLDQLLEAGVRDMLQKLVQHGILVGHGVAPVSGLDRLKRP